MFTKSLRVWVWVSVAPLNCQTKQNKLDKWDRPWELRAFQGRSEGEISNDSRIRGPAAVWIYENRPQESTLREILFADAGGRRGTGISKLRIHFLCNREVERGAPETSLWWWKDLALNEVRTMQCWYAWSWALLFRSSLSEKDPKENFDIWRNGPCPKGCLRAGEHGMRAIQHHATCATAMFVLTVFVLKIPGSRIRERQTEICVQHL